MIISVRTLGRRSFGSKVTRIPSPTLARSPIRLSNFDDLTSQIESLAESAKPKQQDIATQGIFIERITEIVDRVIDGGEVKSFGSATNGFWTPSSDLDLCIIVPGNFFFTGSASSPVARAAGVQSLKRIQSELTRQPGFFCEPRFSARVPILKLRTRIDYSGQTILFKSDVSINNSLAVVNSQLIGAYSRLHPSVRSLGLAVKLWAKARGINDRSKVLPDLQSLAVEQMIPIVKVAGKDVRFLYDCTLSESWAVSASVSATLTTPVNPGYMLSEFFKYYAYVYKSGPIRITKRWLQDTPRVSRQLTDHLLDSTFMDLTSGHGIPLIPEDFLFIDNPFEPGVDVANVNGAQKDRIMNELKRACSITQNGGSLQQLCGAS